MFGWRRSARLCARPAYALGPAVAFDEDPRQVEARTIVNAANTPGDASNSFVISQPGSYYLTGNINGSGGKNGISIQADGVTLDLNGFALIGEATVRNCTLRGNTQFGIYVAAGQCHVVGNTCDSNGLPTNSAAIFVAGSGSRIEGNTCTNNWGGFKVIVNNFVVRNSAR